MTAQDTATVTRFGTCLHCGASIQAGTSGPIPATCPRSSGKSRCRSRYDRWRAWLRLRFAACDVWRAWDDMTPVFVVRRRRRTLRQLRFALAVVQTRPAVEELVKRRLSLAPYDAGHYVCALLLVRDCGTFHGEGWRPAGEIASAELRRLMVGE
jgi:hypothetical protein